VVEYEGVETTGNQSTIFLIVQTVQNSEGDVLSLPKQVKLLWPVDWFVFNPEGCHELESESCHPFGIWM